MCDEKTSTTIAPTNLEVIEKKICPCCGINKPLTDFTPNGRSKDKHQKICKSCKAKQSSGNLKLIDFTARELILELRIRGYRGKLTYTTVQEVVV